MSTTSKAREARGDFYPGEERADRDTRAGIYRSNKGGARPSPTATRTRGTHSSPVSAALVVCAQFGEASAEVVEVINLSVQHLQEALQLHLQVALSVFTLLNVRL